MSLLAQVQFIFCNLNYFEMNNFLGNFLLETRLGKTTVDYVLDRKHSHQLTYLRGIVYALLGLDSRPRGIGNGVHRVQVHHESLR